MGWDFHSALACIGIWVLDLWKIHHQSLWETHLHRHDLELEIFLSGYEGGGNALSGGPILFGHPS